MSATKGASRRPEIWCCPRLSCHHEKVSPNAVSLLGMLYVKVRPAASNSPASTPANGRKRSNRSESTQPFRLGRPYSAMCSERRPSAGSAAELLTTQDVLVMPFLS